MTYADSIMKPIEIIMFEKLKIDEIGIIGFIINPILKHNFYTYPKNFDEWKEEQLDAIVKSIRQHQITEKTDRPSSSLTSNFNEKTLNGNNVVFNF